MHKTVRGAALAVVAIAAAAYTALRSPLGGDYPGPFCRGCDRTAPPLDALASGHIAQFFHTQPVMGPFTLLLRAPVVALTRLAGGGQLLQYRLGDLVCLLFAAALAGLVVSLVPQRRCRWLLQALLLALVVAGPLTAKALWWGHPEELVGGVLCVCAVLLASRDRPLLAGLVLGLAIATKQWGLLAIVPTVIACRRNRRGLLAASACVAAVLMVPMLIGDPSLFLWQALHTGIVNSGLKTSGVTPTNIWFAWGREVGQFVGSGGGTSYGIPTALAEITHPLAIVVGVGLPLLFWRRFQNATTADMLMLLALVFLIRCLLDPLSLSYHHVPFIVALAASESQRRRGIPSATLVSTAALWVLSRWIAPTGNAMLMNEIYLLWGLSLAAYLVVCSYMLGRSTPRPHAAAPRVAPHGV